MGLLRGGMERALLKLVAAVWVIGAMLGGLAWGQGAGEGRLNLGKEGLALGGYDPVSYFGEGGPVKGQSSVTLERAGAVYCFASAENRARFAEEPERYEPAFGGWCAWAMLEGDRVEVDPLRYRLFEGRLLVFYDGFWGDTLGKWVKKAEKEGEAMLWQEASAEWEKVVSK